MLISYNEYALAWQEDRAMLGSNPSTCQDSEKLMERRTSCVFLHIISFENKSYKSQGFGDRVPKVSIFLKITQYIVAKVRFCWCQVVQ